MMYILATAKNIQEVTKSLVVEKGNRGDQVGSRTVVQNSFRHCTFVARLLNISKSDVGITQVPISAWMVNQNLFVIDGTHSRCKPLRRSISCILVTWNDKRPIRDVVHAESIHDTPRSSNFSSSSSDLIPPSFQ